MTTLVTKGIRVSVETFYMQSQSNVANNHFVFVYRINISNETEYTVQLLRRHWFIHDAAANIREVEGEGVTGQKPIILPGESHQYLSWAPIPTEIGKMVGYYLMERLEDNTRFHVTIPEFALVAPFKLN